MRLTQQQINSLSAALASFIHNHPAELRLFGSRVEEQLKGGDIDLLLLVDQEEVAKFLLERKHYILSRIKSLIGDQKIDLIITTKTQALEDQFIQLILPKSKIIWQQG